MKVPHLHKSKSSQILIWIINKSLLLLYLSTHTLHASPPLISPRHFPGKPGLAQTKSVCLSYYRKDTEHLYHDFVYSPISLLPSIYPLPAVHSLLVTYSDLDTLIRPLKGLYNVNKIGYLLSTNGESVKLSKMSIS